MIRTLFFLLLLATVSCHGNSHEQIEGFWQGQIAINQKETPISIYFNCDQGTISCPEVAILNDPLNDLQVSGDRVRFTITDIDFPMHFAGTVKADRLSGTLHLDTGGVPTQNQQFTIMLYARRVADAPPLPPYSIENHSIQGRGLILDAHIYRPLASGDHPGMVLLPGSMSREKQSLSFYADFFARLGVEVLIFDKRGSGRSTGCYDSATYADLADDAIACLEALKRRIGVDPENIGLWGVSQGALLLPYIASKCPIPSFLIAVSPEVTTASQAASYQDRLRLLRMGYSQEEADIAAESHIQVDRLIREGRPASDLEQFILDNARKHLFMNRTGLHDQVRIGTKAYAGFYWSGRIMDFYPFWKDLNRESLVIFGGKDQLVDPQKNKALLEEIGARHIQVRLFEDAGHTMKKAIDPVTVKPEDLDWPRIESRYLELLSQWLHTRRGSTEVNGGV